MMENFGRGWSIAAILMVGFLCAACSSQPVDTLSHRTSLGYLGDAGGTSGLLGYAGFAGGGTPVTDAQLPAGKRLAVSHAFRLRLPSADVVAVQQKHLDECRKLGCVVLTTSVDTSNEGLTSAQSTLRISPDAYVGFARVITAPPIEVIYHSETAEDKTLPLLDAEKRLEVKVALRDRLTAMLRDPGQKSAADLALIEKELAQVQGDIEAAIAARDHLRTITETVKVDIAYYGTAAQAGGVDLSPIDRAVKRTGQTFVDSVAMLISFLIALSPWLPLIIAVAWVIRRALRRWRTTKATA